MVNESAGIFSYLFKNKISLSKNAAIFDSNSKLLQQIGLSFHVHQFLNGIMERVNLSSFFKTDKSEIY